MSPNGSAQKTLLPLLIWRTPAAAVHGQAELREDGGRVMKG